MKTLKLVSLLLTAFLVVGCSSTDDGSDPNEPDLAMTKQKLVGSWKLMAVEEMSEGLHDESDCSPYTVHFSAETCVSDLYSKNIDGICELEGTSVTSPYQLKVNEAFGTIEIWVDFNITEPGDIPPIPSPLAIKHISSTELQLAGVSPSGSSFEYNPIFYYEKEL